MTKKKDEIFSLIFDKAGLYNMLINQDPRCLEYLNNADSKHFRVFLEPVNNTEESKILDALKKKDQNQK